MPVEQADGNEFLLRDWRAADMPELMSAMVADGQHVHCHASGCIWLDIGRPDDYAAAQELFAQSRDIFFKVP